MPRDLTGAHAPRKHRDDLVIKAREATLVPGPISCGSELACRSLGTSSANLPVSVTTDFRP
jgi:hypothetical protein